MKLTTRVFVFALVAAVVAIGSAATAQNKKDKKAMDTEKVTSAIIHTNLGDIEIEFYREDAPKTVENWVQLANKGFYDGVIFHRVISGFMMQGGDPTGTGSGGESIYGRTFADEINKESNLYKTGYKRGVVAMANAGPNTNGSQFFIMHKDGSLPPAYTIFGKVTDGLDVVDKICAVETARGDRPKVDVVMEKITLK